MAVAAFVVACASVLIAGWALVYARRSALEARRSASAAERSADAADESNVRGRRAEERERVNWRRLERVSESRWLLTNWGTGTAYGVRVEPGLLKVYDHAVKIPPGDRKIQIVAANERDFPPAHGEVYEIAVPATGLGPIGEIDRVVVIWHYQPDRSDPPQRQEMLLAAFGGERRGGRGLS